MKEAIKLEQVEFQFEFTIDEVEVDARGTTKEEITIQNAWMIIANGDEILMNDTLKDRDFYQYALEQCLEQLSIEAMD